MLLMINSHKVVGCLFAETLLIFLVFTCTVTSAIFFLFLKHYYSILLAESPYMRCFANF